MARATNPSVSNRVSEHASIEDERAAREDVVAKFIDALRPQLPGLLQSLDKIKDYRNPQKAKHRLVMVLIYGVMCFVLQTASRREANRELSGPMLLEHLRQIFPELEQIPHQDTLNRILSNIEVEQLQKAHLDMIRRLVRNKKFGRWLIDGCYPVAIDGTQKAVSREQVSPEWLQRRVNAGTDHERTQYYVYVLEAVLVFHNGLRLPLTSEVLNYTEGDTDNNKQDCETRAFRRMAKTIKDAFPRLPIMVLLDGLYPNGPILEICRDNRWQFMIVLQDKSLASVWEEVNAIMKLEPKQRASTKWGNRRQHFSWANDVEYRYGPNGRKKHVLHVVVCEERWEEIDADDNVEEKRSRHAWISSKPLTKQNLHERCNLGARHRWGIEASILTEKHHGYSYEHIFSYDWNAMKGYHYLMRLGHALNILAQSSQQLVAVVAAKGIQAFIKFTRDSLIHPWLDPEKLRERLNPDPQLRLA